MNTNKSTDGVKYTKSSFFRAIFSKDHKKDAGHSLTVIHDSEGTETVD